MSFTDRENNKPEMAIVWGFVMAMFYAVLAVIALLFLSGCASAAPIELEHAKRAVDSRAHYVNYAAWDFRELQAGDGGNCAAFAHTYRAELAKRGIPSMVVGCKLPDGTGHAYTRTFDGWALDVREGRVVAAEGACQ